MHQLSIDMLVMHLGHATGRIASLGSLIMNLIGSQCISDCNLLAELDFVVYCFPEYVGAPHAAGHPQLAESCDVLLHPHHQLRLVEQHLRERFLLATPAQHHPAPLQHRLLV